MWVRIRTVIARHGERLRHHLSGKDVVIRIDQLDPYLVPAGRETRSLMNARRSRLTTSACVVHMPCGSFS